MLEWLLKTLAEKVIAYAFDQSGLKEKVSESFKRDATADAFWRSLQKTCFQFERRYPQLAAEDLFNPSLHDEYIPILAQFLLLDGHPNPSDLASLWADALYKGQPEKRAVSMRKLEPIAV